MDKQKYQQTLKIVAGAGNYDDLIAYLNGIVDELADVRNELKGLDTRLGIVNFLTDKTNDLKRTRKELLNRMNRAEDANY